jgi:hypothetical protein
MKATPSWLSTLGDLAVGARFLGSLPPFLRRRFGVEQAHSILHKRLERREDDFLALIGRAVYEQEDSPYRVILRSIGCEHGDLEYLVRREGVEGALRALLRQGIYLTVDELKGRRPVVRGSLTLAVTPSKLRNPLTTTHFTAHSGSATRSVTIDLANVRDNAVNLCLYLSARRGLKWDHALWNVPGSAALDQILRFSLFRSAPVRWFSQVDPSDPRLPPRYRWSGSLMRWAGRLAGVTFPSPEFVPPDSPLPILDWASAVLRAGRTPHLWTYASAAVRVCRSAREMGVDISGIRISMSGEPVTAARVSAVQQVGATAMPRWGATETGSVGLGCLAPSASDDMHLMHDLIALVQPGPAKAVDHLPGDAILISSLRSSARLVLLNVSTGDRATVEEGICDCPMQQLGWPIHLRDVRSFEKLTAGGMTFLDADVIRVLEEVLPASFGGGPTDYQLIEDESGEGHPRLRLLVHPSAGPLDCESVADTFLTSIGSGSHAERVMELQWRDSGLLRVERRAPIPTASGKILHLHHLRRQP